MDSIANCHRLYKISWCPKEMFSIAKTCLCKNAAISKSGKNDNFQMKNCDIFLIFAQNIDHGYTLEPLF